MYINQIKPMVKANLDEVISWRRHFHEFPELSFEEFETSKFISEKLNKMGFEVKNNVGGTGVIATFDSGIGGPNIAFRADMDALPILEDTGLEFESKNPGVMHACGHDCHMAILLGTAFMISQMKDSFKGTIKFIFQPGEEANGGAKCIINDGALENPNVEAIFALHMMPELACGTIGTKSGPLSATDDEFEIRIKGKGAHSSEPHCGVNAIIIAAQVISGLQSVLSNGIDPFDVATFSICQINGGEAVNIIPDYVEMRGMIRCIDKSSKEIIKNKMKQIVVGTAEAMRGNGAIEFITGFPSVNNDTILTEKVIDVAESILESKECCIKIKRPHMGSEDFAYYQEEIPGSIFMLGCAQDDIPTGTLHDATLNINEDSISVGIEMFVNLALSLCGKQYERV